MNATQYLLKLPLETTTKQKDIPHNTKTIADGQYSVKDLQTGRSI
jgi:hypothetical protein